MGQTRRGSSILRSDRRTKIRHLTNPPRWPYCPACIGNAAHGVIGLIVGERSGFGIGMRVPVLAAIVGVVRPIRAHGDQQASCVDEDCVLWIEGCQPRAISAGLLRRQSVQVLPAIMRHRRDAFAPFWLLVIPTHGDAIFPAPEQPKRKLPARLRHG